MALTPPLRGAVVGCGYVSQFHLEAWAKAPRAKIVAVCDLDQSKLSAAASRVPGAKRFTSPEEMFDDSQLDFVEICTRPDSHRDLVEMAAHHGVHVLCQKPVALTRPILRKMIEVCDNAGVRFMVHENWRFRPWYRRMRQEIDAGTIGHPIRIRMSHRETRALRPDGFTLQPYFADMKRLILIEMGCHLVDTSRFLIGEVQTVSATISRAGTKTLGEDIATLSLYFNGGTLGLLDMSWCAPADHARPEWAINETVVEGTTGALKLQTDGSLLLVRNNGVQQRIEVELPAQNEVYVQGYLLTQTHFIDGLIDGTEHETRGTDALRTMDVIWTGYLSAEEGKTLDV